MKIVPAPAQLTLGQLFFKLFLAMLALGCLVLVYYFIILIYSAETREWLGRWEDLYLLLSAGILAFYFLAASVHALPIDRKKFTAVGVASLALDAAGIFLSLVDVWYFRVTHVPHELAMLTLFSYVAAVVLAIICVLFNSISPANSPIVNAVIWVIIAVFTLFLVLFFIASLSDGFGLNNRAKKVRERQEKEFNGRESEPQDLDSLFH